MQNQQLSDVKGKELVAAGHAFAKAIGMDTPLIEIAKMISELAGRLDCSLVRGDELQNKLDAVTVENIELIDSIGFIGDQSDTGTREALIREHNSAMTIEVPATVASMKLLRVDKTHAAIKAQRDALAAENGLAAKAVQTFCDVVGSNTDVIAEEMGIEGAKAILAAMSATGNMPATDAYLNSVRAEGVEMFAKELGSPYSDGEGRDYETGFNRAIEVSKSKAAKFVTQLRAGKDGD